MARPSAKAHLAEIRADVASALRAAQTAEPRQQQPPPRRLPRWDERHLYGSGFDRLLCEERFLEAVATECPEVLRDVHDSVFPVWLKAAEKWCAARSVGERALGEEWATENRFNFVDGLQSLFPDAHRALDKWADKHNLNVPFVRTAAVRTVAMWAPDGPPTPLHWDAAPCVVAQPFFDPPKLDAWDPCNETLRAFRARAEEHISERKRAVVDRGLVPARLGPGVNVHYRWLARWQVLRESGGDIGLLAANRPELRPEVSRPGHPVSRRTVEDAVGALGRALGLPTKGARPRKGRRPKSHVG